MAKGGKGGGVGKGRDGIRWEIGLRAYYVSTLSSLSLVTLWCIGAHGSCVISVLHSSSLAPPL